MKLSETYKPPDESETAVTSRFERYRRWVLLWRKLTPILLDTAGIILLSGSAMLWNLIAGLAAAGIGCFVLSWRWFGTE